MWLQAEPGGNSASTHSWPIEILILRVASPFFFPCKSSTLHSAKSSTLQRTNQFVLCRLLFLLRSSCLRASPTPLATVHLCSIAEWLTTLTVKRRGKKREKQRRGRQACFSAPIAVQEFCAFDFFLFNNQGLFSPLPTQWEPICPSSNSNPPRSFSLTVSFSAAVSSSSFLRIHPFKYSSWRGSAVFFLWLQPLKEQGISDNPCLRLSCLKRCALAVKLLFSLTHPFTYN